MFTRVLPMFSKPNDSFDCFKVCAGPLPPHTSRSTLYLVAQCPISLFLRRGRRLRTRFPSIRCPIHYFPLIRNEFAAFWYSLGPHRFRSIIRSRKVKAGLGR